MRPTHKQFAFFRHAKNFARSTASHIRALTRTDAQWMLLILFLALLVRIPFLSYPDRTVFDEAIYVNYTIHTVHKVPFFDIHPPLARMLFAEVADNTPIATEVIPVFTNMPFSDFPYERVRLFVALCGVMLPLIIYTIGRMLGYSTRMAGFSALFVVFDNALILYSRLMLPDMLMIVASFTGMALVLALMRSTSVQGRILLALLAGIFFGGAVSIKWTAFAVLAFAALWLLFRRFNKEALAVVSVACFMYIAIFVLCFTNFTNGGKIDPIVGSLDTEWIASTQFPKADNMTAILSSLPDYHRLILRANTDPEVIVETLWAPGPWSWPAARSKQNFWKNDDHTKSIELTGNDVLWFGSFFVFLFEVAWIGWMRIRHRKWSVDEVEAMLLIGYMMNFLPFFLIHRPMFLYHYFTALIFLFLLMPRVAPRIVNCINALADDRYIGHVLVYGTCVLMLVNFFLLLPTTFGF